MKEDITQIPRIPFFKLKIVLIPVWELKVSKNRINYTSLCSCTHHVIKSHGSRDYKSYLPPNEGLLFPILIKGTISIMSALCRVVYKIPYRRARAWPSALGRVRRASKGILHTICRGNYRYTGHTRTPD